MWLVERNARQKQEPSGSMGVGMKQALLDYRTWHLTAMMTTSNVPKCAPSCPFLATLCLTILLI